MRPRLAFAIGTGAILIAGCGSEEKVSNPPAAPIESRVLVSGDIPHVRPADFKRPIERYRRFVATKLGAMSADVGRLRAATLTGDLDGARRAWLAADSRYETIGAAYGAFGDLDARINGSTGGLAGGIRSADFTGLHRIELALWGRRSTADAAPFAVRLQSDLARLRSRVASINIPPLDYALRSHEVLEDTLNLQLSGRVSPWSGAALVALRSNVRGTAFVLGTLRGMVARRNRTVLQRIDKALAELQAAIRSVTGPDGGLPRWDRLDQRDRELLAGRTAAAAEELAYVPEIADPRPLRPVQRVFGTREGG